MSAAEEKLQQIKAKLLDIESQITEVRQILRGEKKAAEVSAT